MFRTNEDPIMFPNVDWNDYLFKNLAWQTQKPQIGAKGMVYARVEADGTVKSSVDKFYTQEVLLLVGTGSFMPGR